ncbi:MAG TPA: SUF system Fe-S cluster assembly protein [Marinilabiliaceae bacterium]|nr:SUF system Fe-S cluster assembly protein [Marinilabiliaceae bacterium]
MDDKILKMEMDVISAIKTVYDPEIPVNVYDLGLIYEVDVSAEGNVNIVMTLTSPNCPVAESLPAEVKETVADLPGITNVEVNMTFDPPWDRDMLSDEALLELGLL